MNEQTKKLAAEYLKRGLCIIPVKGKQAYDFNANAPLRWEPYQREPYDIMRVSADCGLAVVLGRVSGNVCALDLDFYTKIIDELNSDLYVPRKAEDLALLNEIWDDYKDKTYAQTTPRGKRLFFTTDVLPPSKQPAPGCEIKSEGHYVVLAPSLHPDAHLNTEGLTRAEPYAYEEYNTLPIMHIEGAFYENFCALYKLKAESEAIDVVKYINEGVRKDDSVSRNYVTLAVAEWFFRKAYEEPDIIQKCLEQNAKNDCPDKERDIISAVKYQLKNHYVIKFKDEPSDAVTLDDVDVNVNLNDRMIHVCGGATKTFVYEGVEGVTRDFKHVWILICYDGVKVFTQLIGDKVGTILEISGVKYMLHSMPQLTVPGMWNVSDALSFAKKPKFKACAEVFKNVRDVINNFVDVEHLGDWAETHKTYDALYAIATYFYELFNFFPQHAGLGSTGSGKSTEMKAVGYQSYHCSRAITSPTAAVVFRMIESCKPTLLLDNVERLYDKAKMDEEASKLVEMLDVGAYADGVVPRVEGEDDYGNRRIKQWLVYCPKMFTSVMGFAPSMITRSIPTHMVQTDKDYGMRNSDLQVSPRYDGDVWAERISANRNDLYALRFKLYRQVQELCKANNLKLPEFNFIGREYELWKPIIVMATIFCPNEIEKLVKYALYLAKEKVEKYLNEVNEAMVRTLIDLSPEEGWLGIKRITDYFNNLIGFDGTQGRKPYTPRGASDILNVLGFTDRRHTRDGNEARIMHMILRRYANMLGETAGKPKDGMARVDAQMRMRKRISNACAGQPARALKQAPMHALCAGRHVRARKRSTRIKTKRKRIYDKRQTKLGDEKHAT